LSASNHGRTTSHHVGRHKNHRKPIGIICCDDTPRERIRQEGFCQSRREDLICPVMARRLRGTRPFRGDRLRSSANVSRVVRTIPNCRIKSRYVHMEYGVWSMEKLEHACISVAARITKRHQEQTGMRGCGPVIPFTTSVNGRLLGSIPFWARSEWLCVSCRLINCFARLKTDASQTDLSIRFQTP